MRQHLPKLGTTAVILLALTACGSAKDPGTVQPSRSGPVTKLTITERTSPTTDAKSWTLTCDPVGGDLPKAQTVCAALDKTMANSKNPLRPTPKGQMCTMIFGGPQTASVTGVWKGTQVNWTFDRKNGCEMKRWDAMSAVFGTVK